MSWLTSSSPLGPSSSSSSSPSPFSSSSLDSSGSSLSSPSSSSTGVSSDPSSADSSEYPQIFLLAIFLPSLFVGLAILYAHYSMKTHNQLRWPFSRTAMASSTATQSRRRGKGNRGELGSIEAGGIGDRGRPTLSALSGELGGGGYQSTGAEQPSVVAVGHGGVVEEEEVEERLWRTAAGGSGGRDGGSRAPPSSDTLEKPLLE